MTASKMARTQPGLAINWSRLLSRAQTVVLVMVTLFFVYIHARNIADGHLTSVPFAVENVVLVGMFLMRRRSLATTTRPRDWLFATIGGWGSLAMQIHPASSDALGFAGLSVQLLGIVMATCCFLALGKSFGIVASNRGLKTHGPYSFVRHPIYLAHFVSTGGFILANPHAFNFVLMGIILVAQLFRIAAEERILTSSGEYAAYKQRVRWRLLPGLF
ncbi:hypothetical protein AYO38_03335 [bacterium SCGC AG-212-C10]|nr:hypothetical protein AYO38_03335 [bacterium SCGC AG-212-C10]